LASGTDATARALQGAPAVAPGEIGAGHAVSSTPPLAPNPVNAIAAIPSSTDPPLSDIEPPPRASLRQRAAVPSRWRFLVQTPLLTLVNQEAAPP
jgi:hypothetical protein